MTHVIDQEICCSIKISEHYASRGDQSNMTTHRVYYMLDGLVNLYKQWPLTCSIACWYCRLPFDTCPIPIAVAYDEIGDIYECEGVACSAACSMAYLNDQPGAAKALRLVIQARMIIKVFGWPCDRPVPTANTWKALRIFGGHLSVEEWRTHEYPIQVRTGAFVPAQVLLECRRRGIAQDTDVKLPECNVATRPDGSHHGSSELRNLKRGPIIETMEQLKQEHPDFVESEQIVLPSVFDEWLATEERPTEETRAQILETKRVEKSTKRKRSIPLGGDGGAKRQRKKPSDASSREPEVSVDFRHKPASAGKPSPHLLQQHLVAPKRHRTLLDMAEL